jgi:ketosteroid isomerase-like protein
MGFESGSETSTSNHDEVRKILEEWAETTRTGQLDRVLANHAEDVLIFDVLPPLQYESAKSYRDSWGEWQPETVTEGRFELQDLVVTATGDLAFAHGLIQCGGTAPSGKTFSDTVRATFCLQKQNSHWRIVHQHISKPLQTGS